MEIDPHSGTTMCRKANIWYIPHNTYLVNQSTASNYYAVKKQKLNSGNHISNIYHKLITRAIYHLCVQVIPQYKYITKLALYKKTSDTGVTSYSKIYKTEYAHGPAITTVAASFGHNIPTARLQPHQLRPGYLQPKGHHLYGCGGLPHLYR
jgi:hypothetical protein